MNIKKKKEFIKRCKEISYYKRYFYIPIIIILLFAIFLTVFLLYNPKLYFEIMIVTTILLPPPIYGFINIIGIRRYSNHISFKKLFLMKFIQVF